MYYRNLRELCMIIYVARNAIVVPIASTPDCMVFKFYTLLLKVNCFEGILNWCKTKEWWMIIQAAVTHNDFKKFKKRWFAIFKQAYHLNQWSYGFETFSRHYPLIKFSWYEGLLNWNKIGWMVSKHLSSFNMHQFKNITEDHFSYLVMPMG